MKSIPNSYASKKNQDVKNVCIFIVAPLNLSNEPAKLNEINYFGKRIFIEEANSQENFNATKKHQPNISHRPQHVVNRHPERERDFRRKKLVPGSRSYAEVSTSSSNLTPN